MSRTPEQALHAAIRIVGSQAELARQTGCAQPTVWKWVHQAHQVAAEYVLPVERATAAAGQEIHRSELRPDLYPPEEYQTPGVRPGVASAEALPRAADAPFFPASEGDPASGVQTPKRAA